MMTSLIIDSTLKGFVLLAIAVIIAAALYKTSSATWHLAWPGLAWLARLLWTVQKW
jgi:hypothetical protein